MIAGHKNIAFIWKVYWKKKLCFPTSLLKFSFKYYILFLKLTLSHFLLHHNTPSLGYLWTDTPAVPLYFLIIIFLSLFSFPQFFFYSPFTNNFYFFPLSFTQQINLFCLPPTDLLNTRIWLLPTHVTEMINVLKTMDNF